MDTVFLKSAEAFDYRKLLKMVVKQNIKGTLEWEIKAFLNEQKVKSSYSKWNYIWKEILLILPQGTILASIVYNNIRHRQRGKRKCS